MMMEGHYPDFDVMRSHESWDDRTQEVVFGRTTDPGGALFFSAEQAGLLQAVCTRLLADNREELLKQVVAHIDRKIASNISDGYRKAKLPDDRNLYSHGLKGIDETARAHFKKKFTELEGQEQDIILTQIASGFPPGLSWQKAPARDFFQQLLREALSVYASLPAVWSYMGYAGPAYPRGYVRIE
ncbi:gluconate 2-dehydrogenase subunit 3 family protein, partial [bacterium]